MCYVRFCVFDELSEFSGQSVPFLNRFPMYFNSIGIPLEVDHLIRQKVGRKNNPK